MIKANYPHVAVIGLSVGVEEYAVYAMIKAGASEVVEKELIFEHLPIAIRKAPAPVSPSPILKQVRPFPHSLG